MKNSRESNFELLRIVAILGIIISHITLYAVVEQLGNKELYEPFTFFNNFRFYKKLFLVDFCLSFGKIGNTIFLLITGYFLCEKEKINISKQTKKILTQAFIAAIVISLVSLTYQLFFDENYIKLQTISLFNNSWWFIGYYLFVIFTGAIFLNKYINKLTKEQYRNLLIILFSIVSLKYLKNTLNNISETIPVLITGIFLYSLGGYIKKYNPFKKIKVYHIISIMLFTILLMYISYYNSTISNINIAKHDNLENYYQTFILFEDSSLVCIILGISMFELFRRIKIKTNKTINYISSSVFMIYLVHENWFARPLFGKFEWIKPLYNNLPLFIGLLLLMTIILFVIGLLLYIVYSLIMKLVNQYCKKYLS